MRGEFWNQKIEINENWSSKKILSQIFIKFGLMTIGWVIGSLLLALPIHFLVKTELGSNLTLFILGVILLITTIIRAINSFTKMKYIDINPPTKARTTYFMIIDGIMFISFVGLMMIIASYEIILLALGFGFLIIIAMIAIGLIANKKTINVFKVVSIAINIITMIGFGILLIFYFFGIFSARVGFARVVPQELNIVIALVLLIGIAVSVVIHVYGLKKNQIDKIWGLENIKKAVYYQAYLLFSMYISISILIALIIARFRR